MTATALAPLVLALLAAPGTDAADDPPATRARARGSPIISASDYPRQALRNGEQGLVRFELDIAPDGAVAGCRVTQSSGSTALDHATCTVMAERARFRPARNASGTAVADRIGSSMIWEIPPDIAVNPPAVRARARANLASYVRAGDYPEEALRGHQQGEVRFTLEVSSQGRVTACRVTATSGNPALDRITCLIMLGRARFTPARDAGGRPVPDIIESRIRWSLGV